MDPAKRICLKNLPEGCTKREIAELVRNRTGIQPHSIDLGLNSEGRTRNYAHFSCESTKNVLEVLGNGIMMRDSVVYAYPANPHFTYKYMEARRKREREEEKEARERSEFWEAYRASALARFPDGEPVKIKPPKPFYASRQKYYAIAAEIAEKCRKNFHEAHPSPHHGATATNSSSSHHHHSREDDTDNGAAATPTSAAEIKEVDKGREGNAYAARVRQPFSRSHRPHEANKTRGGKVTNQAAQEDTKASKTVIAPTPLLPSKEERKLSSLQARLLSLGAKIYKNGSKGA
ncbi:unnamed protein product [Phytomonas sp. EM1]|nr:unnamed protein product [Phytomonas sp. EM1]|eukprot:CCW60109.1 unnamed protein product [Phytomonas sp. isolate EM1]